MKTYTCLTLIGLLFTSLISCKKAGPAPNSAANKPTPPVDTSVTGTKHDTLITDVYATGDFGGRAQLWKNGVGTALSNVPSTGLHVVVLNGNTYVCGDEQIVGQPHAVYWKNFEFRVPLTDGTDNSSIANDIVLQGSDILCVGTINDKTGQKAVLWRNGQVTVLASNATATGILVKGNDIYITGSYTPKLTTVACYWKNGIVHDLGTNGQASGIAIDNNSNVYLCGTSNSAPVYWKNDVMAMLPKTRKWAWANAICIQGDDVYIVGSGEDDTYWGYDEAYYWKNGIQQYFPGGSSLNDIIMVSNNIFITGTKYSDRKPYGRLWENTSTLYLQPSLTVAYLEPNVPSNFTGLYIDQHYSSSN